MEKARKDKKIKITYRTITNFHTGKYEKWLQWWSKRTFEEDHVMYETPHSFRNKLKCAVFAFHGKKLVGAGGIMMSHLNNKKLFYKGRLTAEFRAVCVDSNYQKMGIGDTLIKKRLSFSKRNNFFCITLTKQPKMPSKLEKLGWKIMDDHMTPELFKLKKSIRQCKCQDKTEEVFVGERCSICPFLERITWFHPD